MSHHTVIPPFCPDHGTPKNRQACAGCNAAYMRGYLRRRSEDQPEWAIWLRAKKRASRLGLVFDLPLSSVWVPSCCPALGTPLILGEGRSPQSPSLDRIDPNRGYIIGNCRVISDHANRIKGNLDLYALRARAEAGTPGLKGDYEKLVAYVEREQLLAEVRCRAALAGRAGEMWSEIERFLEDRFRRGFVS